MEDLMPEREIEEIAAAKGHQSFVALAKWLKMNRESLEARLDHIVSEIEEIKQDGKETKAQVKLTNGRVTKVEQERAIEEAIRNERERQAELLRVRRAADLEVAREERGERTGFRHAWQIAAIAAVSTVGSYAVVDVVVKALGG